MRRQRRWGERKGSSVSGTFFSRRLAERAGWQPQRGGWRRTGRRAGQSGDGPLAPTRQSRRGPGRALQSRVAAAVEAESEFPQEPAHQAERPCPTWNQNGRTSTSLRDLITSPCILRKRGLGCSFWVGALAGLRDEIKAIVNRVGMLVRQAELEAGPFLGRSLHPSLVGSQTRLVADGGPRQPGSLLDEDNLRVAGVRGRSPILEAPSVRRPRDAAKDFVR